MTEQNMPLDKWQELNKWVSSNIGAYPLIDENDFGKVGIVVDMDKVETKYGLRARVLIDFGNNEVKAAFVGKSLLRDWLPKLNNDLRNIIEKKVKINKMTILGPQGKREKYLPELIE